MADTDMHDVRSVYRWHKANGRTPVYRGAGHESFLELPDTQT